MNARDTLDRLMEVGLHRNSSWSDEVCRARASVFKTVKEWARGDQASYMQARRYNWLAGIKRDLFPDAKPYVKDEPFFNSNAEVQPLSFSQALASAEEFPTNTAWRAARPWHAAQASQQGWMDSISKVLGRKHGRPRKE